MIIKSGAPNNRPKKNHVSVEERNSLYFLALGDAEDMVVADFEGLHEIYLALAGMLEGGENG